MKVLIIEDEPLAQQELKRLLQRCQPQTEVLDCLDSVEDSVAWLQQGIQPDLIFMDIRLSDGSSFEIFDQVAVSAPVIFTTAYNEYALQAFKVNSIEYLLKPIEEKALQAALEKLSSLKKHFAGANTQVSIQQLKQLLKIEKPEYKDRFVITVGDRIRHIASDQIAYFFADDNTVFLVTLDRKKYVINFTLDELEALIDPKEFYRVSRKYMAHIQAIVEVNRYFNSRLKVTLTACDDDEILVSRARVPGFLEWMGE
ncbi:LytTR family DNA-binding domain-containing protein [Cytophagaceae bacterium YF14B1]|uniref:LytTR family DNA-binding domain-containing protein n=1 Tax=Xanthocytophaga flava TaxID=3048013 RepID=A0AAE3QVD3_9BACT|nr:LytTR family DNA-binding domain-containing protein [Xanthocytophaga flavus]MDJ1484093.1 LytTR family DNA-binding domain-containing protein [Xanthocytophaga flavus]